VFDVFELSRLILADTAANPIAGMLVQKIFPNPVLPFAFWSD
jgi:hypothetical protein